VKGAVAEAGSALGREKARQLAWELYATDIPAVVELILLVHNEDVSTTLRYAATQALTWFDPEVDQPEARLPEPPALRAIRWACYAWDRTTREAAAAAAIHHLARWGR
jgi:hypothetical protein